MTELEAWADETSGLDVNPDLDTDEDRTEMEAWADELLENDE